MREMKKQLTVALIVFIISASLAVAPRIEAGTKSIVIPDEYSTIAEAVGNASDGDTIFVKQGIYHEHALIINKSVSIIGENAETTTILNIDNPFSSWNGMFPPPSIVALQITANNTRVSDLTICCN
jgi:pectin methylesterase-like acyl-CoA thioesterase